MPLPELNEEGDLPVGRYVVSLGEVLAHFGVGGPQRVAVTNSLRHIYHLAVATGSLERLVIFGSYITAKADPNDVDVILVMHNDFAVERCPVESQVLFDHARADKELGASIFWVRPDMLLGEPLEQFLAHWQRKRDHTRRGIVEVRP